MCQNNNNTKSKKGKHLNYCDRQFINGNNKPEIYYFHL